MPVQVRIGMISIDTYQIGGARKTGVGMGYMGVADVVLDNVVRRIFFDPCLTLSVGMDSLTGWRHLFPLPCFDLQRE